MPEPIIQVSSVSKKYVITHEGQERYTALRDVMAKKAKKIFSIPGWRSKSAVTKEEFFALQDVSFHINKGDRVGIIGRNGAGKSTLLKILSRITEPTSGRIQIKGRVASLLEVGTGFHPELSGRENIFLNGAILGMSRSEIKRHFDAIVDFAEVERFLDTPVKRYSSGMYVRLAFAVAAHLEPEILVVDEVLAVGDAQFQKKCLGKMEDVSRNEGRTVLFVSHNMAAISTLCTRGILLSEGKLVADSSVDNVLAAYIDTAKIESNGHIEFANTKLERFGEKKYAHLESITLKNGKSEVTNNFAMGEKMFISFQMDVRIPGDDYEIGVAVGNLHGVQIHYFVSPWEGITSLTKTGNTNVEIEVPRLMLFPGSYFVTLWIALRGAYYDDAVHNAISFTVEEGKINEHDTYFTRFSKNTQVYAPSIWRIT
jgi:lipopolysaccharide transport system ATP-binding protein